MAGPERSDFPPQALTKYQQADHYRRLAEEYLRFRRMKNLDAVAAALRRDVRHWKAELVQLRAAGHDDVAAKMEGWIKRSERILDQLDGDSSAKGS